MKNEYKYDRKKETWYHLLFVLRRIMCCFVFLEILIQSYSHIEQRLHRENLIQPEIEEKSEK